MAGKLTASGAGAPTASAETSAKVTAALLLCGAVAGPVYLVVGLAQALTRPGFDLTRHDLSLLANGDLGWIQVANLVVSGLLGVAGAVGMRRAVRSGRAALWGPPLGRVAGPGLGGAGVCLPDPAPGSPAGAPADARARTR